MTDAELIAAIKQVSNQEQVADLLAAHTAQVTKVWQTEAIMRNDMIQVDYQGGRSVLLELTEQGGYDLSELLNGKRVRVTIEVVE